MDSTRSRADERTDERSVANGTYYTTFGLVAVLSGLAGLVFPLAWACTVFCVGAMLVSHQAETSKADAETKKQAPLKTAERATGCGASFVLVLLLLAGVVALVVSLGGALP